MNSTNIVITGKQQVELRSEPLPELPADGVAVRTRVSLISSGTETICYRGESDPGSHWHQSVRYPFYPEPFAKFPRQRELDPSSRA